MCLISLHYYLITPVRNVVSHPLWDFTPSDAVIITLLFALLCVAILISHHHLCGLWNVNVKCRNPEITAIPQHMPMPVSVVYVEWKINQGVYLCKHCTFFFCQGAEHLSDLFFLEYTFGFMWTLSLVFSRTH